MSTRIHRISRNAPDLAQTLSDHGIPEGAQELLSSYDPRPRLERFGRGLALTLRFANLNEGARPEDMIALRLWICDEKVLLVLGRPIKALQSLNLEDSSELSSYRILALLVKKSLDPINDLIKQWNNEADTVEDALIRTRIHREHLSFPSRLRRKIILLKRHLGTQKDMLESLEDEFEELAPSESPLLLQTLKRWNRIAQDIEHLRERGKSLGDEIHDLETARTNRHLTLISVAGGILLPMTLISGLLGMNVGGIPLADHPWGFWIICATLGLVAALGLAIAKLRRWF